jgi:hypothetical protein
MKRMNWVTMTLAAVMVMAIASLSVLADRRYSERQIFDLASRNGYEYGVREGRYDNRNGNRFDPKKNRAYKDGKYGYRDEYYHDGTYRDGFRQGFLSGYDEGFNGRNGGYNRRDDDYDYRRTRNGRNDERCDDDYDNARNRRRNRRDDDEYDYRRGRDDDRDRQNGRNNRNGRNNGWWDILTGAGGVYDDMRNQRPRP